MVDFFKDLCTNKELEEQGVWSQCTGLFDIIRIKVARAGNKSTVDLYNILMAPYKKYDMPHAVTPKNIEEEKTQLMLRIYAETILLDVEGDFEIEGKKFVYSTENAIKLLGNNDFFNQVLAASNKLENYRTQELEDNSKNLKKASSGKSSTAKSATL